MRWIHAAAAVGLAVLGMLSAARGESLASGSIPANARWVIHVDGDALRSSKLWDVIEARFITPHQASFDEKVRIIETLTGLKFPTDVHDVTLYGTAFTKEDTCILIHAVVDQAKVTSFLKLDPEFQSVAHNDHDVLSWRDKDNDRILHAAFFGADRIIVSPSQRMVETALDAMDGKAEVLKGAQGLAAPPVSPRGPTAPSPGISSAPAAAAPAAGGEKAGGAQAAVVLYVAGQGLSDLQKAQNPASPIFAQADAAWLSIAPGDEKLVARLWVKTKSEKAAEEVQDLAKGVRALLALTAAAEHADDKTRAGSAALENLIAYHEGAVATVQLAVPLEVFKNLLEANHIGESQKAAPAAADKMP